ncbi:cyclopropane fatty acyl phospholipid synthase [Candidatus Peregrinibacteria bacterium]|nr:cyclopropane fatty acyl phospholipid synthase [Candidatus Peregrinibacteria bacterium]
MSKSKKVIIDLLAKAGIKVNGNEDWDIQVHNDKFYSSVISGGSLALGESYMKKWWDSKRLDLFFNKLLRAKIYDKMNLPLILHGFKAKFLNMQSRFRSRKVIDKHYDLSNELYESFLDPYNQYTCGYFDGTDDLNEAQVKKLELICKKLQLKKSDRVLDIGCGWGGFAKYAAEHYGCHVTGISISDEQIKYAKEYTKGLPVEIKKMDYRDLEGKFDKITVVGMIEHVGYKNYRKIMKVINKCLAEDGLFLLHTIGDNVSSTKCNPWMDKYIFPNGMLPSIKQIGKAYEKLLIMEDWHNFGPYYYNTLMAWDKNFRKNWTKFKKVYSEKFYRMWRYYLLSCAGAAKARHFQLWQIVFSKGKSDKVYQCVR